MYFFKRLLYLTSSLLVLSLAHAQTIDGELKKWHKVTLSFEGPQSSETAPDNPFTDYRLEVTFTHGGKSYKVPGYFAADGDAANTSATSGNIWRVHFAPDETGTWTYQVEFRKGNDIAINGGGTSAGFMDGKTGNISISPTDKTGRDHRAKGRLEYVGEHYLQYAQTKEWFLKAGADAPENKFSYVDFDDTPKPKKDWSPHLRDYVAADAADYTWKNGKGKGLLGAIAYLSGKGANAFSFLTFSLDGDDDTVYPHLQKTNGATSWNDVHHDRFDVSKMDQWEKIFEYGDKKGMYLHFKTQETENDQKMDGGDVGRERKLYYRELIARFSHHLALNWNLGEENSQTTQQERDMAQYFYDVDPYHHNIVIHTYPGQKNKYDNLTGTQSKLTGASLQTSNRTYDELFRDVDDWVEKSAAAGKKWVVAVDEPGNASIGTHVDPNDRKLVRHKVVWATLMAGGAGVEFYYGYQSGCSDLTCEDHRTRDQKYTDAAYALKFFQQYFQKYLPSVVNDNQVTGDGNDYVLRNMDKTAYAVYRPNGGSTGITLPQADWKIQWYNPRSGQLQGATDFNGQLSAPDGNDWVALLTTDGVITPDPDPEPDPDPVPTGEMVFEEVDGYVAVEAEHFVSQEKTDKREWYVTGINKDPNVSPDPDGNHAQSASGGEYLEILPDTRVTHDDPLVNGVSFSNKPGVLGILSYKIYFNNPGKYYVWVRAHSTGTEDNGIHVGLNGNWPGSGERMQWCNGKNQWTWESKQRTNANHCGEARKIYLDIPSKGIHTINFSMREDGFEFDKFFLSKAYEKPDGNGPDERLYQDTTPEPDPCLNNSVPELEILQPGNNTKFEVGTDIAVNVEAKDKDGKVESVRFYLNGNMIAEDKTAPYSLMLTKVAEGIYELYAIATDNCKATAQSSKVAYTVANTTPTPTPDPDPTPTECDVVINLDALTDFPNINVEGFVPAYKDPAREALAVDANLYKDQYAAAYTVFQGPAGKYNIKLHTLTESDGESTYRLKIDGNLVGTYTNPANSADYQPAGTTFETVEVSNGAMIQVEFNSTTNGKVQEGSSFGYSRGRWTGLSFVCTKRDTTAQPDPTPDPCANNSAPEVSIINPDNNTSFEVGADIMVNVDAKDRDGKIESVHFYLNGNMIAEDKTSPYSFMLTKALEGEYELYAVAKDDCKATTQSDKIFYTVVTPESEPDPQPDPDPNPTPDTTETQVVLSPIHDAYLQYGKRYNTDELRAELNKRATYLMFDLSEVKGKIMDARLQLTVGSDPGYGEITVSEGSHNNWTETNIADENKPKSGSILATQDQTYNKGERVEWNLGEIPNVGQLSFVVSHINGNDVSFISKEHRNKAGIPKLILTVETVVDTLEETPTIPDDTTKVNPDPLPVSHVIPGIIQAEKFDDQQGIRTQATTDDGAGENIGWIQKGDYTSYNVYAETTAVYTATFRVASATNGGNILLYSDDEQVASVAVDNTGGWQSWESVSVEVNLKAGNQNLKMLYEGGNGYLLNVNWVSFEVGEITPDSDPEPTDPCGDNKAPTVVITQPGQSSFTEGSTIEFLAEAMDEEGSIKTVEYILNGQSVQIERVIPYTYTMSNAQAGSYEIVAVVTDGCDVQTRSVAFKFEVTATQQDDPTDPVPPVTDCEEFAEKDGILIMEAESLPVQAPWVKKSDNLATGGEYIQWTGGNSYGSANKGVTDVKITITKTGKYRFLWSMRQPDGVKSDLSNDSWINFPDTKFMDKNGKAYEGFIKIFGNGKGDFAWRATADVNHQKSPVYIQFDKPGTYTFQLAGRSDLHQIDRIILFHESVSQSRATNLQLTETKCFDQQGLVDARTAQPNQKDKEKILRTFPNPAFSELYIDGENLQDTYIRIFDMTGREVIRRLYSLPLDISNLSPGLYHVLAGDYQIRRFVKK